MKMRPHPRSRPLCFCPLAPLFLSVDLAPTKTGGSLIRHVVHLTRLLDSRDIAGCPPSPKPQNVLFVSPRSPRSRCSGARGVRPSSGREGRRSVCELWRGELVSRCIRRNSSGRNNSDKSDLVVRRNISGACLCSPVDVHSRADPALGIGRNLCYPASWLCAVAVCYGASSAAPASARHASSQPARNDPAADSATVVKRVEGHFD